MTPEELKEFSKLCGDVLTFEETGYQRDKEFIKFFFPKKNPQGSSSSSCEQFEQVRRRLILIDALYSTQMSKRFYGIDELAKKICEFSDAEWVKKFKECLTWEDRKWLANGDEEPVRKLFNETYGIEKESGEKKRCISLISKYAYFLCEFCFPIYDSLVIKNFNTILDEIYPKKKMDRMPQKQDPGIEVFIKCLRELKEVSGLSYEDIDHILWTYGKLRKGSLSAIVTRDEYKKYFNAPIKFKTCDNENAAQLIENLEEEGLMSEEIKGRDASTKLNRLMKSSEFRKKIFKNRKEQELNSNALAVIDDKEKDEISFKDIRLVLEAQYPGIIPEMKKDLFNNRTPSGFEDAMRMLKLLRQERQNGNRYNFAEKAI